MATPPIQAEVRARLEAPFAVSEVRWKPQTIKGNRALVVAYISARAVMDRLDDVFGPENWQDEYEILADGAAMCRLTVRYPGTSEWITKVDVGGESEQPDEGDRRKASISDALKRAAVKVGIGRYLYSLPMQWVDYDPQKRALARTPTLPSWAVPVASPEAANPSRAAQPKEIGPTGKKQPPRTGLELLHWLEEFDRVAVGSKIFSPGELTKLVLARMRQADRDLPFEVAQWPPPKVGVAVGLARGLWKERRGMGEIDQIKQQILHELERLQATWEEFLQRNGEVGSWDRTAWAAELTRLKELPGGV